MITLNMTCLGVERERVDKLYLGEARALCMIQLLPVTRFGGHMDVNY